MSLLMKILVSLSVVIIYTIVVAVIHGILVRRKSEVDPVVVAIFWPTIIIGYPATKFFKLLKRISSYVEKKDFSSIRLPGKSSKTVGNVKLPKAQTIKQ